MKLSPSVGCRLIMAALTITLLSASQIIAATAEVAISWGNPADIVYGTALGATQQNATAANKDTGAAVTGTFSYNPIAGTVLPAGTTQALTVTFTPTKASDEGVNSGAVSKTVYITVTKKALSVKAPNRTSTYGADTAAEPGEIAALIDANYDALTVDGLVNGDTLTGILAGGTRADLTVTSVSASTKANTSHVISFSSKPTASNYQITYNTGTLTVGKKGVTITAPILTSTYGATPSVAKSVELTNKSMFETDDQAKIKLTQVHSVDKSTFAGTYDVTIIPSELTVGILDNYDVNLVAGTLTVAKRPITVTLNGKIGTAGSVGPGPFNINYGEAHPTWSAAYTIDTTAAWEHTATIPVTGDALKTLAGLITTPASITAPAANAGYKSGGHEASVSGAVFYGDNFAPTYVSGSILDKATLNIYRVPLVVEPNDKTMVVGSILPAVDYGISSTTSLYHGDSSASVLGDKIVVDYSAAIKAAGDGSTLTVGSSPYTGAIVLSLKTGATNASVTSTASDGTTPVVGYDFGNYLVNIASVANLTVTPVTAAVSWTLAKSAITYGEVFSKPGSATGDYNNLDLKVTTLQPGTTTPIAGTWSVVHKKTAPTAATSSTALSAGDILDAGTYLLTATFQPTATGGGNSTEWGATSVSQTITVNKKLLTVTAVDKLDMVYGDTKPTIAVSYETADFVTGDNSANSVATAPAVVHNVGPTSNVDTYTVTPSGGVSANYAFEYKSGSIKVSPQTFSSITWAPAKTTMTYGQTLADIGAANAVKPTGVEGVISYSVDPNSPRAMTAGSTIVHVTFTPTSPNYAKFTSSTTGTSGNGSVEFTVSKKAATVTPDGVTVTFGDAIPSLTGTSDFLVDDGIVVNFNSVATKYHPVGSYYITASYDDSKGRLRNYDVTLESAADSRVVIEPATLNVEAISNTGVINVALNEAAQELRLTGLKGEAAVLNGIALTSGEVTALLTGTSIDIGTTGAPNVKSNSASTDKWTDPATNLEVNVKDMALLGRVFNTAFSLDIDGTAINAAATYDLDVIVSDTSGSTTTSRLKSNYVLGTNTSGTFTIGKEAAVIAWSTPAAITYGTKVTATQLNASVGAGSQSSLATPADKLGTFDYRIGSGTGEAALNKVLPAGKHTLHVTYTPHADDAVAYTAGTKTVELTVNQAALTVAIKNVTDYVYGDSLPQILPSDLTVTGLVNGDTSPAIFEPGAGGIQPVVAISPQTGKTNYVAGSTAVLSFGQDPKAANYSITTTGGTMAVAKRPLTVQPNDVSIPYGGTAELSLKYIGLAPGDTPDDLGSAGFAYVPAGVTSALSPTTYTIFAQGAYGSNYTVSHVTGTLTVAKASATVSIAGTEQTYDGTGKSVTITTEPAGLSATVTYDGLATLPVDAGSYDVQVDVSSADYAGTATGTLTIAAADVEIVLSKLAAKYNGSAKAAVAKATPEVPLTVTYDGESTAPKAVGSYAVVAKPTSANYAGEATGTLVIGKGTAFIIPSGFSQMADGTAKKLTVDTDPAGLDTTVTYVQVNPAIDAILLDFGNEGATASGTPGSPWQGFNELVVDEAYDLGNGITMTAQGDGFSPNNPAGSGAAVDYDGITVPVAARDDYLFKTDDTPGGTAKLVFNGLPAGVYNVTMFEGRTTDKNQVAKLWAGGNRDEPAEANVASFAGGGTTVEVTVAEGDTLYYLHMEDGSGGISGMIIRNVSRPDTAVDAPVEPGIYSATITVVDDSYQGSLTTAMGLIPGATLEFDSLSAVYNGKAQPVTVNVDPVGVNVLVTYNKNTTAPTVPGTYPVVATINDEVYSGTISGDYVIEPAAAGITISNLEQPFNGAVAPTVVTEPAGLATVVTYSGAVTLPTQPGEYEVVVTVVDDLYAGSESATLVLGKGSQNITFPAVPNLSINGVSLALVLNASASSGLPVTYNVLEGNASLEGNLLTISQPGVITIVAQQLGNEVYAAAEEKTRFFTVTGTGIPLGAAQSVARLNDDGSLSISTSGQPFQQMSVYKAGEANGEFTPILKVMLDENGQSTFKTETSGDQGYFQVK